MLARGPTCKWVLLSFLLLRDPFATCSRERTEHRGRLQARTARQIPPRCHPFRPPHVDPPAIWSPRPAAAAANLLHSIVPPCIRMGQATCRCPRCVTAAKPSRGTGRKRSKKIQWHRLVRPHASMACNDVKTTCKTNLGVI
jgi:hypothetical protein